MVFLTTLVTMTLFAVLLAAAILGLLFFLNAHSAPSNSRTGWFGPELVLFLFGPVVSFLIGALCSLSVGSRISRLFWKPAPLDGQNPSSGE
jgi:hypothetical protein